MYQYSYLVLTILAGAAYSYYLVHGHFFAVELDKNIGLQRSPSGEIRMNDLRAARVAASGTPYFHVAKTALADLWATHIIAGAYVLGLICIATLQVFFK